MPAFFRGAACDAAELNHCALLPESKETGLHMCHSTQPCSPAQPSAASTHALKRQTNQEAQNKCKERQPAPGQPPASNHEARGAPSACYCMLLRFQTPCQQLATAEAPRQGELVNRRELGPMLQVQPVRDAQPAPRHMCHSDRACTACPQVPRKPHNQSTRLRLRHHF